MKILLPAALALSIGLAACGSSTPPPPPKAAETQAAQPLPKDNIFKSDIDALNKAKNVQNIVNDQQKAQEKALQDAGG
jgi:hypothetical protein